MTVEAPPGASFKILGRVGTQLVVELPERFTPTGWQRVPGLMEWVEEIYPDRCADSGLDSFIFAATGSKPDGLEEYP